MEPSFSDGQIVLTTALNTKLQKGDVIILKDPYRPEQKICKRVVGLPGNMVTSNGFETVIPKGHMWLEGDNKSISLDSRIFGPVALGLFEGLVFCRLWPFAIYLRKSS
jgi:inner membrane protease subunit 1